MRKATSYIHIKATKTVRERLGYEIDEEEYQEKLDEEKLEIASKAFDAIEGVIASLEKE
jgi:hypothetical protein